MEKSLRIGILHYSCPPIVGGVEEVIKQQAITLSRLGQSVSILAGMGGQSSDHYQVQIEPLLGSQNDQINKAHRKSIAGDHTELKQPTMMIYEILLDWSRKLDVILAHNVLHMPFNLPLTLALRRFAALKNRPAVVSWAHDSPFLNPLPPEHLNTPPWSVLNQIHANVHYVTISESRKQVFEEISPTAWTVIRDGIDPNGLFYLDPKSVKVMEELNLLDRDLVVIQPARITPRKDIELSIHIIYGFKKMGLDALLILTGAYDPHETRAPAYYRRLKYWINELGLTKNITFLAEYMSEGKKIVPPDRSIIRDFYLMADLLLMTSKDEGFGLPLLEAGLLKLPIACSEIPAFQEVGEDICFFGLNDPPLSISGRILEYLNHIQTHHMFRHVMRKYVWDVICKKELLPFLYGITGN
ncbi:MAG: glycosyltransferase family 4 protein [Deltaproteobacteria bacterium]|nr:glycosyltransferase family 4 protein [Deltaproteobacteria bacterium]